MCPRGDAPLANIERIRGLRRPSAFCGDARRTSGARGEQVRRSRLALLSPLALLLVSGRPDLASVDAPPVSLANSEASEAAPDSGFGPEAIVAILRDVNPRLSENELHRIAAAVLHSSAKYGIDPELVTAVMWEESDARPWVRSPKGAIGLMQVMPYMSARMEIAGNLTTIEKNIEAGCLILSDNIRRLGVEDGISAYFWGSEIRGVSYLHRVLEKRASVRRLSES
jgi:soluble lytic murein transglycosylase-like protein